MDVVVAEQEKAKPPYKPSSTPPSEHALRCKASLRPSARPKLPRRRVTRGEYASSRRSNGSLVSRVPNSRRAWNVPASRSRRRRSEPAPLSAAHCVRSIRNAPPPWPAPRKRLALERGLANAGIKAPPRPAAASRCCDIATSMRPSSSRSSRLALVSFTISTQRVVGCWRFCITRCT